MASRAVVWLGEADKRWWKTGTCNCTETELLWQGALVLASSWVAKMKRRWMEEMITKFLSHRCRKLRSDQDPRREVGSTLNVLWYWSPRYWETKIPWMFVSGDGETSVWISLRGQWSSSHDCIWRFISVFFPTGRIRLKPINWPLLLLNVARHLSLTTV